MQLITAIPASFPDSSLPAVALRADRPQVVKRIWRGRAEDGTEFGFDLAAPLRDGEVFWQTPAARYVLRQNPEPVVEIPLDFGAGAVAALAWAIGNLHLELAAEERRLLAPDEPAVRQMLDRLQVRYRRTTEVFHPGRFAHATVQPLELGTSHKH